jgi:alpha-L-fucosidase
VPIRRDWFWSPDNAGTLKSLDELMSIYARSVGHGCNLLLNHTPDMSGLIPEADAKRAAEFGDAVAHRFGVPIAATAGNSMVIELALEQPAQVGWVVTMEEIRQGERVLEYQVEALLEDGWKQVAHGSAIGHKKIDRVEPVTTARLRLSYLQSIGTPEIRSFAAYAP